MWSQIVKNESTIRWLSASPNQQKEKNMLNFRSCMTALDHYCSYLYYAWSSDTLRLYDLENVDKFIQTSLHELVFDDPTFGLYTTDKDIEKLLNEAAKISFQMITAYECKKVDKFLILLNRLSECTFFYKER